MLPFSVCAALRRSTNCLPHETATLALQGWSVSGSSVAVTTGVDLLSHSPTPQIPVLCRLTQQNTNYIPCPTSPGELLQGGWGRECVLCRAAVSIPQEQRTCLKGQPNSFFLETRGRWVGGRFRGLSISLHLTKT